jgi:RNA recognition motif-containing protein
MENSPTRREIFDLFEEFGKIEHLMIKWNTDRENRQHFPGYCFIGFRHSKSARRAVRCFKPKNSDEMNIRIDLSEKEETETQKLRNDDRVDDLYDDLHDEKKFLKKFEKFKDDFKRCPSKILLKVKDFVSEMLE